MQKTKYFLFQKIILGKKVKLFLTLNLVQEKNLQHNWKNNYCSYEYDKPHYKDLLGKLFPHIRIYTFGLKDFNSHILTTICTSVPGSLKIEVLNRACKHKIQHTCTSNKLTNHHMTQKQLCSQTSDV